MVKNYLFRQIISTAFYPVIFIIALWVVFLIKENSTFNFTKWGVLPREMEGLPGILASVFVHGDIDHIVSNSIPLLVLGMLLFFFYKKIAKPAFFWIWIVSGIWLWIGGRNNIHHPVYHIGASTLIYGLATFLFFSGVFRKHLRLMVVSALVVFLYGSIMWGIFPIKEEISWEGHLFGALAGILVAFNYRKEGPQKRIYEWEAESEEDDNSDYFEQQMAEDNIREQTGENQEIKINYIFKNNPNKGSDELK